MKKILIFAFVLTCKFLVAQNWTFNKGDNPFDGNYRTASVVGIGSDSPYNNPMLVVNLFNEKELNFYISSAGYFQSLSDIEILWAFDNEPKIHYETTDFTISKDGKSLFLNKFKNLNSFKVLRRLEFIRKFKLSEKVHVRIKNKHGKNDIVFSLSGCTQAINSVISEEFIEYHKTIRDMVNQSLMEHELKTKECSKIIEPLIAFYETRDFEIRLTCDKVISAMKNDNFQIKDIDSVKLKMHINLTTGTLTLFDKDKNKLTGFSVGISDSSNMAKTLKLKGKKRIIATLDKYEIPAIDVVEIIDRINDKRLRNIEEEKVNNVKFEFFDSHLNIVFNNNERTIESLSIFNGGLIDNIKTHVKRYNKNIRRNNKKLRR